MISVCSANRLDFYLKPPAKSKEGIAIRSNSRGRALGEQGGLFA